MTNQTTVPVGLNDDKTKLRVWLHGDKSRGHPVDVPMDLDGLRLLYDLILQRELIQITEARNATIGEKGGATQQMVDAWLKNNQVKTPSAIAAKEAKEEFEAKYGVDLSDIEIEL